MDASRRQACRAKTREDNERKIRFQSTAADDGTGGTEEQGKGRGAVAGKEERRGSRGKRSEIVTLTVWNQYRRG